MDTQHDCMPSMRVSFPGPFAHHDVVVDGWSVPLLKASPKGMDEDGVRLILDDRRAIDLSSAEAERFLPFLANAIAVAMGYGAHPRENMKALPERMPHMAPRPCSMVAMPTADDPA
jgi:hypothetical protein